MLSHLDTGWTKRPPASKYQYEVGTWMVWSFFHYTKGTYMYMCMQSIIQSQMPTYGIHVCIPLMIKSSKQIVNCVLKFGLTLYQSNSQHVNDIRYGYGIVHQLLLASVRMTTTTITLLNGVSQIFHEENYTGGVDQVGLLKPI